MTRPQYRPDVSIKLTIWTSAQMKTAVDQVCRKWEAFESDVIRMTLEAMIPLAARSGWRSILSARLMEELASPAVKKRPEQFPMKITVRTSEAIKRHIVKLGGRGKHSQAEILRYAYQAGLPIALSKGMSHLLALREQEIARAKKKTR